MTELSNVTFHSNTIFSCIANGEDIIYSVIPNHPIPLPFRLGNTSISINAKEFPHFLRENVGLGKYRAAYTTHDYFVHEGKISPLSHQLGFLLRVIMNGEVELREEEIIYNSINNIEFLYFHYNGSNMSYTHTEIKNVFTKALETEPMRYLDYIEEHLQLALDEQFIGMYPREIWHCFDMISVCKVQ